jgi:hypothetical protein
MAKGKKGVKKIKKPKPIEEMSSDEKADAICPTCGVMVDGHRCRLCDATKSINQASGNQIWMRNGRLVAAFKDSRQAYVRMALQYGIPREKWPEEFKDAPTEPIE